MKHQNRYRWLRMWRYGTLVILFALLSRSQDSVASRASFVNLPLVWQRAALHSTEQRPSLLSTTPGQTAPPSQSARGIAEQGMNEQSFQVWIPVIAEAPGPSARVRFGAGRNGDELLEEGTSFSFGLTTLYYAVSITDSTEGRFREEWIINGQRQPTLDRSGLLPQPEGGSYLSGITLSTGAPLPLGEYELRIFVDERQAGNGRLQILPLP